MKAAEGVAGRNAAADTIIDLQSLDDEAAQPLQVVSLDGVPLDSRYGRRASS